LPKRRKPDSRRGLKVRIFIGYSITVAGECIHKFGERLEAVLRAGGVSPEIRYGEFQVGDVVFEKVRDEISSADICIFDVTSNNHNVLIESGWAKAQNKEVFLIKVQGVTEKADDSIPSDLAHLVRLACTRYEELVGDKTLTKVNGAVRGFLTLKHPPEYFMRALWGLDKAERITIACSRIPETIIVQNFEDYVHLREFGDLDALQVVRESLLKLYPEAEVRTVHAKSEGDLPRGWENDPLILIGGADVNPLVTRFYDYSPVAYYYGQEYEDIGIFDSYSGKLLRTRFKFDSNEESVADWGYFLKQPMPSNPRTKLIVIGGCHTWGVLGAAELFNWQRKNETRPYNNARTVVEEFGDDPNFVSIVHATGDRRSLFPTLLDLKHLHEIHPSQRWKHPSVLNGWTISPNPKFVGQLPPPRR